MKTINSLSITFSLCVTITFSGCINDKNSVEIQREQGVPGITDAKSFSDITPASYELGNNEDVHLVKVEVAHHVPTSFKDFNTCFKKLFKIKKASPDKPVIKQTSAGEMLVGKTSNEKPDLHKVVTPNVATHVMPHTEFSSKGSIDKPKASPLVIEKEFKTFYEMGTPLFRQTEHLNFQP